MVMKEQFEILIAKDGRLKITVKGVRRKGCEKSVQRLKELIAPDVAITEQGRTWEYDLIEEHATENLKLTNPGGDRK